MQVYFCIKLRLQKLCFTTQPEPITHRYVHTSPKTHARVVTLHGDLGIPQQVVACILRTVENHPRPDTNSVTYFFFHLKLIYARALIKNSHDTTNKCTIVKIIFLTRSPSQLRHVSIYLDHLQWVTEHQYSLYNNKHGLLQPSKFVQKMSIAIMKFICGSAELIHNIRRLQFHKFFMALHIRRICWRRSR